jgi:hypothetical protein
MTPYSRFPGQWRRSLEQRRLGWETVPDSVGRDPGSLLALMLT